MSYHSTVLTDIGSAKRHPRLFHDHVFFVARHGRRSVDTWRELQFVRAHGAKTVSQPLGAMKPTHIVVGVEGDPKYYYHELDEECGPPAFLGNDRPNDWTLDHLVSAFDGSRGRAVIVQGPWLQACYIAGRVLGASDGYGGWRVRADVKRSDFVGPEVPPAFKSSVGGGKASHRHGERELRSEQHRASEPSKKRVKEERRSPRVISDRPSKDKPKRKRRSDDEIQASNSKRRASDPSSGRRDDSTGPWFSLRPAADVYRPENDNDRWVKAPRRHSYSSTYSTSKKKPLRPWQVGPTKRKLSPARWKHKRDHKDSALVKSEKSQTGSNGSHSGDSGTRIRGPLLPRAWSPLPVKEERVSPSGIPVPTGGSTSEAAERQSNGPEELPDMFTGCAAHFEVVMDDKGAASYFTNFGGTVVPLEQADILVLFAEAGKVLTEDYECALALVGVHRGARIVTPEWIFDSVLADRMLPPDQYAPLIPAYSISQRNPALEGKMEYATTSTISMLCAASTYRDKDRCAEALPPPLDYTPADTPKSTADVAKEAAQPTSVGELAEGVEQVIDVLASWTGNGARAGVLRELRDQNGALAHDLETYHDHIPASIPARPSTAC